MLADTKYHDEEFSKSAHETANEKTLILNTSIAELKFRIERCLVFAPTKGPEAMDAAKKCIKELLDLVDKLSSETGGNPRKFIVTMNEFNKAAREAHAEILGIRH